jgi:hypothetical protein
VPLSPGARLTLAVLLIVGLVPAFAHDVPLEHLVEMAVEPRGTDLLVRVRLPAAAVRGNPNLPGVSTPIFDAAVSADRLRIVAADFAHNLELRQGDVVLPATVETAQASADRSALDVALRYPGGGGAARLSARLNAFRTAGPPVRTIVRYRLASGREHTVSVTGPAERITLDPGTGEVLQQFIGRGVRVLLNSGDHLLFLLCVLLPMRRVRSVVTFFGAAAAGQAIAIGLSVLWPAPLESAVDALAAIAASAVVVFALQNVVGARERLIVALAFVFGLLNGFVIGHDLVVAAPFAWSHPVAAAVVFASTVLVGQLWLGALAWAIRTWLDERGVPERILMLGGSALLIHTAAHRLVARGQIVAQAGTFGAERALVWITLAWIAVMLVVAVANALSARATGGRALAETTGAQAS